MLQYRSKRNRNKRQSAERPLQLLTLSAKSESALQALVRRYQDYLLTHPDVSLADLCFTANTGRKSFRVSFEYHCRIEQQLSAQLADFLAGKKTTGCDE